MNATAVFEVNNPVCGVQNGRKVFKLAAASKNCFTTLLASCPETG